METGLSELKELFELKDRDLRRSPSSWLQSSADPRVLPSQVLLPWLLHCHTIRFLYFRRCQWLPAEQIPVEQAARPCAVPEHEDDPGQNPDWSPSPDGTV